MICRNKLAYVSIIPIIIIIIMTTAGKFEATTFRCKVSVYPYSAQVTLQ